MKGYLTIKRGVEFVWFNLFNDYIYYALIFLIIFFSVLCIKHETLLSNILLLDDLVYFPVSIDGGLRNRGLYFLFFSFHNKLLLEPSLVRLLYLMIYSVSAVLTGVFLRFFIEKKIVVLLLIMLAFLNPATAIMVTFINGSYNVLFYFFFISGLVFFSYFTFNNYSFRSNYKKYLLLCLSILLLSLSFFFTTNGILLPFAAFILPWWSSEIFRKNKKEFLIILGITASILVLSFTYALSNFNHGYSDIDGRIDYSFLGAFNRSILFISNFSRFYLNPKIGTTTGFSYDDKTSFFDIITIVIILIVFFAFFIFKKFNKKSQVSNYNALSTIPFLTTCVVFSMGPLMTITISHLWHYFLPGVFIVLFLGVLVFGFFKRSIFVYLISIGFILVSVNNLIWQQNYFNQSTIEQKQLIRFLQESMLDWRENSQILIRTNKTPFMTGLGVESRDLGFVKFHSKRTDIKAALVVTEEKLNYCLFNGQDVNSQKIISSGKFDKNYPIFLYDFNYTTGEWSQKFCLVIIDAFESRLYFLNDNLINLTDSITNNMAHRAFQINELNNKDCLLIIVKPQVIPKILEEDVESYVNFDGHPVTLEIDNKLIYKAELFFEILLKSNNDHYCFNREISFSDQCPPMPLLAHPIAIYQDRENRYSFQIRHLQHGEVKDTWIRFIFENNHWYKFRFVFNLDQQSVSVFINDFLYEYIPGVEIDIDRIGNIKLGEGYLQRSWIGKVGYFRVYDNMGNTFIDFNSTLTDY